MANEPIVLTEQIKLTPPLGSGSVQTDPLPGAHRVGMEALSAAILAHGERTSHRFIEFFTGTIRNRNTRYSYARAVKQFFDWCDARDLGLNDIEPIAISAYIELLGTEMATPSVKQHLAAPRMLFDWLVIGQVIEVNPAHAVRGPK